MKFCNSQHSFVLTSCQSLCLIRYVESSLTLQGGYYSFPHFIGEEAGIGSLRNVLRVTELVSDGAEILILAYWTLKFGLLVTVQC